MNVLPVEVIELIITSSKSTPTVISVVSMTFNLNRLELTKIHTSHWTNFNNCFLNGSLEELKEFIDEYNISVDTITAVIDDLLVDEVNYSFIIEKYDYLLRLGMPYTGKQLQYLMKKSHFPNIKHINIAKILDYPLSSREYFKCIAGLLWNYMPEQILSIIYETFDELHNLPESWDIVWIFGMFHNLFEIKDSKQKLKVNELFFRLESRFKSLPLCWQTRIIKLRNNEC